ncbi:MAG TPA: aromatic ring-hydroxylating dioxygenase subunit alpha [Ilumatobacteraceae bacterium]|jgi:nitrite reductase/ring-hydroxylating ferredoxin subunit
MADNVAPTGPRSDGITYQQLLDTDPFPVPDVLRLESPKYLGSADVPAARYTSREWHEREVERLWKRVWQFACREEQIPYVGSHIVYEIANLSFIVVRTAPDEIKAYYNACLHRGRQLKDHGGRCSEFRCPYHGFTWALDGSLSSIPARWDFEHVDDANFALPEAQVGTWGGFVFLNPDPDAGTLADFLGELPSQFERWKLEDRYIQGHVHKIIRANWKVVQEAFCESYHAPSTHPQTAGYLGDVNSQIDIWDNFARVITPGGTPSPLLRGWIPTEEEILRYMLDIREDEESYVRLGEGQTARAVSAAAARERWRPVVGDSVDEWSDSEFIDNIDYTVFPNMHPWGAYNRICYRFRPNGDNHREAIMEVFLLAPFSGDRPAPASTTYLGPDDEWIEAPELGMLAKVFSQDSFNMPKVQRGLEATAKPGVTLANYQESKVRWLHDLLGRWVEG